MESIRHSFNEALRILVDPYRLFTEAPDAISLLLTQAVFEKLWIMDAEVVGSERIDAYLELLTVEARLTLDEQHRLNGHRRPQACPGCTHLLPASDGRQR